MFLIKKMFHWPLALLLSLFVYGNALAIEPIHTNLFGSAIDGYDPVAYFKDNKPVEGVNKHVYEWNGAKWYFKNAENKADFIAEPEKYAPQYGGYCAWAVVLGAAVETDPTAWHVEDGKLYLNYNADIKAKWSADIPGNIAKADVNWPTVLAK
jgi:YHS domain-containing protein